ncbi:hypothetical protein D0T49_01115 [Paludibacter sp. 221]|uniref:hypothetical protein n=1 Tax=Paludibacter sp. 221 TaxID=2302939 RepID=UPI0013D63E0E|nr:hypothetical protein [Paludibacter sp. 221]NDV45650.1 hypothetical protein [Paludibacter sp. 221]
MKFSLNFLDRWENKIFCKYNDTHTPMSKFAAICTLIAACIGVVIVFVMQMVGTSSSSQEIVLWIVMGCAFLVVIYNMYSRIKQLPSIGNKIGYIAYISVLFYFCAGISAALASFALILVLILLALWIWAKVSGGSSGDTHKVSCDNLTHDVINGTNLCRHTNSKCPMTRGGKCPY